MLYHRRKNRQEILDSICVGNIVAFISDNKKVKTMFSGRASCLGDDAADTFVLAAQGVGSAVKHFTVYYHVLLCAVARAAAYEYLVVRLEGESRFAVYHKAVFQAEREVLSDGSGAFGALRIFYAACHVDTYYGSRFTQTACGNHEVFEGHVVGIRIVARMSYFAEYLYVAQVFQVVDAGDVEYVVFLQRDVGLAAVHDGADVYLLHFAGLVFTLAVQYGTAGKGVGHQSVGFLYQFAYGVQLVHFTGGIK